MTRWENYLASAEKIIRTYDSHVPLHHFLKSFFKQHPHMGSRDRRWVSQLVYHYFRLGYLWKEVMTVPERIQAGTFLCETQPNEWLAFFRPDLNEQISLSMEEKLAKVAPKGEVPAPDAIFPFVNELSEDIDAAAFARSFFVQPRLFIRVRNKQERLLNLLQQAGVAYEVISRYTIALPNSTKIDDIITNKGWYEIQDISSQQTGQLFKPKPKDKWWDCCAASGGKAILLKDLQPTVDILVTDVRATILDNLKKRFSEAGIKDFQSKVMDLTGDNLSTLVGNRQFDGIILDAPCSGSGTWGRTPENLSYFTTDKIQEFQQLQKRIAKNVIPFVKPGGTLIYITCSVFKMENEEMVQWIVENSTLKVVEGGTIKGYHDGADSMFAVKLVRE